MLLLRPIPFAALGGSPGTGMANLGTASPREVFVASEAGVTFLQIDLGGAVEVDAIFAGFANASGGATWAIERVTSAGVFDPPIVQDFTFFRRQGSVGPRHHAIATFAAVAHRYWRVTIIQGGSEPLQLASLMLGKRIDMPHEFGGGRGIVDTGAKEALPDGGFGIGAGVVKASLRWEWAGLNEIERKALWAFAKDRGERRPIVAVDDASDQEGIHYGLFDRLDVYERRAPDDTRWAMSMTEWA